MNLSQLSFMKPMKMSQLIKDVEIKYTEWFVGKPDFLKHYTRKVIGIDPGKNFGAGIIINNNIIIRNGVLDDKKYPLRDIAFYYMQELCKEFEPDVVVIEGASYGDRFGQVKLAEVRCGFALGASEKGFPVIIIAPKTPRKTVFGSGDKGAMDVWPTINHNAADALCLALYPLFKEAT